jgi:glucose uptake protein GlcU
LEPAAAAAPGAASGAVWGAANACTILAIQSLGLGVAYPIVQAGLFVAGLWGVLLFSELTFLLPQLVFWLSGAALVAGAGLLTAADC